MTLLKQLLSIIVITLSISFCSAQQYPVNVDITLFPPYPTDLDHYLDALNQGIFDVENTQSEILPVYFEAIIRETGGLLTVRNDFENIDPVFIPSGLSIFDTDNIDQVFGDLQIEDVMTEGMTEEERDALFFDRQLPEGTYELCLFAWDENGIRLSDPTTGCFEFDVYYAERPMILDPFDGENLEPNIPYIFDWLHDVNDPMIAGRLDYTVRIIDLTENDIDNPELAMLNPAIIPIYETQSPINTYSEVIDPAVVFLVPGHEYAARVSARDPLGQIYLGTKAHSEIVMFTYDIESLLVGYRLPAPAITNEDVELEFGEGTPVIIEWEHDFAEAEGEMSYTAAIIAISEDDEGEAIEVDLSTFADEELVWESDQFQSSIILDGDEVDWEVDQSYAMYILAESSSEQDTMNNDGYSEIYEFTIVEAHTDELQPAPVIVTPINNSKVVSSLALTWEHEADTLWQSTDSFFYKVMVLDLTKLKIPSAAVSDFENLPEEAYYTKELGDDRHMLSPTTIIPLAKDSFKFGHTYAVSIIVEHNNEEIEFENDGYSNIITFSKDAAPVIDEIPLPFVGTPLNQSSTLGDSIEVKWGHYLSNQTHKKWIDSTKYQLQVIDLTATTISTPTVASFTGLTAKVWDKPIISRDTTVRPLIDTLINGHRYAVAIKAVGTSSLTYGNSGYSNIAVFTKASGVLLPYIVQPEDNQTSMLDTIPLRWEHDFPSGAMGIQASANTKYIFKLMDLTKNGCTASIQHFEATTNNKLRKHTIIRKDTMVAFRDTTLKFGHQYAYAVQAVSLDSTKVKYDNQGYSNIIKFTRSGGTTTGSQTKLPFITSPIDKLPIRGDSVSIVWEHNLDTIFEKKWMDSTSYRLQIIDLTKTGVTHPKADHFASAATAKFWDKALNSKDTTVTPISIVVGTAIPSKLVEGHKYAMAVRAIGKPSLIYANRGYSNIVTFTRSDSLSLPFITAPVNDQTAMLDSFNLKWKHIFGKTKKDSLARSLTSYRLQMIDQTVNRSLLTVASFRDTSITKVIDKYITSRDTFIQPPTDSLKLGHNYLIAIQAVSSDSTKARYPNHGYSDIVKVTHHHSVQDDGCPGSNCIGLLPTDQVSVPIDSTRLSTNNTIFKMGDLDFTLGRLDSGDEEEGYNGEGVITVGFIGPRGIKIKVAFEGIMVNAANQVFEGTASALYDTDFLNVDEMVSFAAQATIPKVDHEVAKTFSAGLRSAGKLASALSGVNALAVSLPLGFDRVSGLDTTVVGITEMSFSPTKNELAALFTINNPDWGQWVPSLAADKICFNNEGFAKQVRLYLADDYVIPLPPGDLILEATDPDDPTVMGTYVELNCRGFKEAQISASLAVDRQYLLPMDEDNQIVEDSLVKAKITFSGIIQGQGNFLLAANLTPCQLPSLEGFILKVQNGYFDGSDKSNPPGMAFPNGYLPPTESATNLWRGVWFEEISLVLPTDWTGGTEDERTEVSISNFIFDDFGASFVGSINNLLTIEKGRIEGTAISIDEFEVEILRNQLRKVSLNGRLGLPILPDDKYLSYEGLIDRTLTLEQSTPGSPPNQQQGLTAMSLTVTAPDAEYEIPSLLATIRLDETTQLLIKRDTSGRGIEGVINGALTLGDSEESGDSLASEMFAMPSIRFEGLGINTVKKPNDTLRKKARDIFTAPTFSLNGIPRIAQAPGTNLPPPPTGQPPTPQDPPDMPMINGFDFGLDEFSLEPVESEQEGDNSLLRLTVGGHVGVVTTKGPGFALSAEGSVSIECLLKKPDDLYQLEFSRVAAGSLGVDSQFGAVGIKGDFEFYNNDEDFGDGVVGNLEIGVTLIKVNADVRFGIKSIVSNESGEYTALGSYPYGYVFAEYIDEVGKPMGQSGAKFHSLLGGLYFNMGLREGTELSSEPREKYFPDQHTIGFKAGIGISFADPKVLYGRMGFEVEINLQGGINHIALLGQLDMLQEEPFEDKQGTDFEGIRLQSRLAILPPNQSREDWKIAGDFIALANVADGVVVGNRALNNEGEPAQPFEVVNGDLDITIGSKFEFTMNLGTIANKGSLKFVMPDLGDAASLDIVGQFYLQASAGVPPQFADFVVPDLIQQILNSNGTEDFTPSVDPSVIYPKTYDESFAMAAGLQVTANMDVAYSILYADFQATLGFDVSLKGYSGIACANNGDSALGIGPNQHYAKGQVYAGLTGQIGLDVDVFFYKGKIQLASLYAAMLLEGGFPNPIYANGYANMGFSVLGGIVSGDVNFAVELGEPCDAYQADPLAGINFIEGIDPGQGRQGVSPFVKPQASFVNKLGNYYVTDHQGNPLTFIVELAKFDVIKKVGNQPVASVINATTAYDKLSSFVSPNVVFEPNTEYIVNVEVKVWQDGVEKRKETKTITFRTGAMPDYVPWGNVQDCYPFRDETYYMIDNNVDNRGLIKLGLSQQALFDDFTPSDQKWHSKVVAEVYRYDGNFLVKLNYSAAVQYQPSANVIHYDFPSKNLLSTSKRYHLYVKRIWYENPSFDISSTDLSDLEVNTSEASVTYTREGKSYSNADENRPPDKVLASYRFNTSKFRNFYDKIKGHNHYITSASHEYYLQLGRRNSLYVINNGESFSEQEIGSRSILESRTVNVNSAFIQEKLFDLTGGYYYEKAVDPYISGLIVGFNFRLGARTLFREFTFDTDDVVGFSFDYDDLKARRMYTSRSSTSTRIYSRLNEKWPSSLDYTDFDYMHFKLAGWGSNHYQHDLYWNHRSRYNRIRHFFMNKMNASWNEDWKTNENAHRKWYLIRNMYRDGKAWSPNVGVKFQYTVPVFRNGVISHIQVVQPVLYFAKR